MAEQTLQFVGYQESTGHVFRKVTLCSLLMIVVPLVCYFFSKTIVFEAVFGMTSSSSYFYAAIVAIIAVHVFLGLFIYMAFMEGAKISGKKD